MEDTTGLLRILICDDVMLWNPRAMLGDSFEVTTAETHDELEGRIRERRGRGDWDLVLVDMVWDRPRAPRIFDSTRHTSDEAEARPSRLVEFDGVDVLARLEDSGLARRAVIYSVGGPGHRLWIEEASRSPLTQGSICKNPPDLAATIRRHLATKRPIWDPLIPAPRHQLALDVIGSPTSPNARGQLIASMLSGNTLNRDIAAHTFVAVGTVRKRVEDLINRLIEVGEIGAHLVGAPPQTVL